MESEALIPNQIRKQEFYLLNAEKLVYFRLSREKRLSISQFSKNASNSPDVDLFAVIVTE
jgi:hypothetical protein